MSDQSFNVPIAIMQQITSALGPKPEVKTLEAAYRWRCERLKSNVDVIADVSEKFVEVPLHVHARV